VAYTSSSAISRRLPPDGESQRRSSRTNCSARWIQRTSGGARSELRPLAGADVTVRRGDVRKPSLDREGYNIAVKSPPEIFRLLSDSAGRLSCRFARRLSLRPLQLAASARICNVLRVAGRGTPNAHRAERWDARHHAPRHRAARDHRDEGLQIYHASRERSSLSGFRSAVHFKARNSLPATQ